MQRWLWLGFFAALGLVLVGCALLVPAHLRAVDAAVVEQSGSGTPSVVEAGFKLLSLEKVGAAEIFLQVAQAQKIRGNETLALAVGNYSASHPDVRTWGGTDPYLEKIFANDRSLQPLISRPILEILLRHESREKVFQFLRSSRRPAVGELLKARALTNTVYFPPVASASGQALEAVIALTGLLLQGDQLSPTLQDDLVAQVLQANRTGNSQKLEKMLLDFLTLGGRMNWTQLAQFVARIDDSRTLGELAYLVRANQAQWPVIFTAVDFSGQPATVSGYLLKYRESGVNDVRYSLGFGLGGLRELLLRGQRVYHPGIRGDIVEYDPFGAYFYAILDWCRFVPWATIMLKFLLFLAGGFCLARACHYGMPPAPEAEQPLQVPALAPARQGLWAVFFLLVMVFLSEPFLAQENQQMAVPLRQQLPKLGSVVPAGIKKAILPAMNYQLSLVSLIFFFVVQALIYTACLLKLAEIRRQAVGSRLKLRLLENEEHLFDAGLYLGFVGTIISLILMSLGVIRFSLMAGYSSTSFGIIFVSVLKIFHVRPYRRKLIIETETA
jgi:hypothetical protein